MPEETTSPSELQKVQDRLRFLALGYYTQANSGVLRISSAEQAPKASKLSII
jgi:hypothetical protein